MHESHRFKVRRDRVCVCVSLRMCGCVCSIVSLRYKLKVKIRTGSFLNEVATYLRSNLVLVGKDFSTTVQNMTNDRRINDSILST